MDGLRLILIVIGAVVIALIYLFSRRAGPQQPDGTDPIRKDTEWMEEIARQRRRLSAPGQQPSPGESQLDVPVLDESLSAPVLDVPETPPPEQTLPAGDPEPEPLPATEETENITPEPAEKEMTGGETSQQPEQEQSSPSPAPDKELVMALHVMAPDGGKFEGATLFSALEESGLRFGEGGIFHCHLPDGDAAESSILFSVANMLEPGTFEGEKTEQTFATPGVAMFMRAPGATPAREMLEKMLLTAQQVAQKLGGEIRDGRRQPLSEPTIQEMLDRASAFDSGAPGS